MFEYRLRPIKVGVAYIRNVPFTCTVYSKETLLTRQVKHKKTR